MAQKFGICTAANKLDKAIFYDIIFSSTTNDPGASRSSFDFLKVNEGR